MDDVDFSREHENLSTIIRPSITSLKLYPKNTSDSVNISIDEPLKVEEVSANKIHENIFNDAFNDQILQQKEIIYSADVMKWKKVLSTNENIIATALVTKRSPYGLLQSRQLILVSLHYIPSSILHFIYHIYIEIFEYDINVMMLCYIDKPPEARTCAVCGLRGDKK